MYSYVEREGLSDDKLIYLTCALTSRRIDIICIIETHINSNKQYITDDGFCVVISGDDSEAPHHAYVGFIIAVFLNKCIMNSQLFFQLPCLFEN